MDLREGFEKRRADRERERDARVLREREQAVKGDTRFNKEINS